MTACGCDVSLAEALSDPVVRAVMDADRVDPRQLAAELNEMARTLNLFGPPHVTTAEARSCKRARTCEQDLRN